MYCSFIIHEYELYSSKALKGETLIMDRRMYRGNMGRDMGYRRGEPMRDEVCPGKAHEDKCERHMHEDMCERERHDGDFDRFPLAMCYVPWQCFRNLYENDFTALAKGTLFKELDLDWYGRGCK